MNDFPTRMIARCAALCLAALIASTPAHADHVKLFLLGGQSNMVGTGTSTSALPTTPVNLQQPQDDVLFYYKASVGLTTLRPGSGQTFGPEITFGRTVADALPDQDFGIIKYATSGSRLHEAWDPTTGSVYAAFRDQVTAAQSALTDAGHTYEIVGMLWTQGEGDARNGRTTAQYEGDLNEFIGDIRTRYGTNLPFFFNRLSVGQLESATEPEYNPGGFSYNQWNEIRTAQENVASIDPNAYLIDADSMSFHDELHFDGAGQIALGEAFAQSYLSSVPEPGSLGLLGLGGLLIVRRRRRD